MDLKHLEKYERNPIVGIRMAPEEKAVYKQAAAHDGKTMAGWFRSLAKARVEEIQQGEQCPCCKQRVS